LKGKGRVSDVYDDIELPYPDAKVTEKFCFGGACLYKNCDEDDAFKNSVINSYFSAEQLMVIQSSLMLLRKELIQRKAAQDEERVVNWELLSCNFLW
jgi:hypothetical protein